MNTKFTDILKSELKRIDDAGSTKRKEAVISGFTKEASPKAIIDGNNYIVFNSNDYLGLRLSPVLLDAEHESSLKYGAGPGAVRFISGTMKVYKDLEAAISKFHNREAGMVFSSAFATNVAVMSCLLNPQSKDSLVSKEVCIISDTLNHRSIIDGIRTASISKEQKFVYKHLDYTDLRSILESNKSDFKRAVVVTDGVFSMIGEAADLSAIRNLVDEYDQIYEQGVLLVVDDSHGAAAFGQTGRGTEEVFGAQADILVGTFGKGFGSDGGYVVASQLMVDYLRESASTYIYSNSISPSVAGAALASVAYVSSTDGQKLLQKLEEDKKYLKDQMKKNGLQFVADSGHPIQPLLVGDTLKAKELRNKLFEVGILVTNITYPVVPKGKDEIRIQLNASHTKEDIDTLVLSAAQAARKLGII